MLGEDGYCSELVLRWSDRDLREILTFYLFNSKNGIDLCEQKLCRLQEIIKQININLKENRRHKS